MVLTFSNGLVMTAVEDLPVVPGGWDTAVPIRRG